MIKSLTIKTIKWISYTIGLIVILVTLMSFVIQYFYKERLTQFIISELNKQVDAKIDVQSTTMSFWKTFPNISVGLNNVVIHPANKFVQINKTYSDTLLNSNQILFEFNIIKLLTKNFIVNKIRVQEGNIFLVLDKNGNQNYSIFKKGDGSSRINLQKIIIQKCNIRYSNYKSKVYINTYTNRSQIGALLVNGKADLKIQANLFIFNIDVDNNRYIENYPLVSNCNLSIDNNVYQFKNVEFSIDKLNFLFNGNYTSSFIDKIDFKISGDKLKLTSLNKLIPTQFKKVLSNYTYNGYGDITISIKGDIGNSNNPLLNINCNIIRGSIEEKTTGIKLEDINSVFTLTNGSNKSKISSTIQILKFDSKFNVGYISLQGDYTNFIQPVLSVKGNTKLNLNDLKEFLKLDTFEILEGNIEGNFNLNGKLVNNNKKFNIDTLYSEIKVKEGSIKFKSSPYSLSNINGSLLTNTDIHFKDFTFKLNDFDIKLNGRLINGLPYVLNETNEFNLVADVFSPYLDFTDLFKSSDKTQSNGLKFFDNVFLNLHLEVNEFKYDRFHAKWIKGNLEYKPTMYILKSFTLETLDGNIKGNCAAIQDIDKKLIVRGLADLSKINIQNTFNTFYNFSQNFIKDSNLRGRLSGKVNFTSEWDNTLKFLPEKLLVDANIKIQNGELINFEPMNGLSRFISLDELRNIKFSTLTNTIYIKDKQLIIPEMDINSSAFNISGSGIHYFDNHYNYKVRVLLSEFLYGKAKKAKKENEEYGRIEDDGLGRTSIYLNIEGFGKDYKVAYDSRKTMDVVKESLVKQKKELKEILHEEFGWFKNDSTLNDKRNKTNKTNTIQVQFDDEPSNIEAPGEKKQDSKTDKKQKTDKVEVEWE